MIIHLPIHDEILSSCHKDDVDEMVKVQEEVMLEASNEFIKGDLSSVDTNILTRWTK